MKNNSDAPSSEHEQCLDCDRWELAHKLTEQGLCRPCQDDADAWDSSRKDGNA